MNTKNNRGNVHSDGETRNATRNRRLEPSRRERLKPTNRKLEPVATWKADVRATSNGPNRADLRRKVRTNGIKAIDATDLLETARRYLRQGYEVRLAGEGDGEAIRLYPCLDANYEKMFVACMTMGEFRQSLGDIAFRMEHCGETVDPNVESAAKCRKAESIRETQRTNVTPDTVVTCPNCGTEIRVGKVLE